MLAPIAMLHRWNRRRSRLVAALVNSPVAFGLLIVALLAAGWNYLVAESSRERVAEANRVVLEVERLFSAIKDLETGERGFVLVGGENYLIPYDEARITIDQGLGRLKTITHGHLDASLAGGRTLEALVADKRDFAARVVALRKEQGFEAATELVRTGEGKRTMDAIRAEAAAIRVKLTERVDKIQRSDRLRGLLLALLTGAAAWSAVVLLAWLLWLRREDSLPANPLLEGLVAGAPIGLGVLDRDLRLQHGNGALARLGVTLGKPLWTSLGSKLSPAMEAAMRDGVTTTDMALPIPAEAGERIVRLSVYPLSVPNLEGAPEIEGIGIAVLS